MDASKMILDLANAAGLNVNIGNISASVSGHGLSIPVRVFNEEGNQFEIDGHFQYDVGSIEMRYVYEDEESGYWTLEDEEFYEWWYTKHEDELIDEWYLRDFDPARNGVGSDFDFGDFADERALRATKDAKTLIVAVFVKERDGE